MLWIGEEGKVYCILSVVDECLLTSVGLATEKEDSIGFLFQDGKYQPVVRRNGAWTAAFKEEAWNFYHSQVATWIDNASRMPRALREAYELVLDEAYPGS